MDILQIVVRAVLTFGFLILIMRTIGKRMLSQMTNDQFAGAITLGSIAGNAIFNLKIKLLYFIVSFVVFAAIVYAMSLLGLHSRRILEWFEGKPAVIIAEGRILEESMRRERYTLEDLKRGLRSQGIFNIEEVELAILETDGSLSVSKKESYRHITRRDAGLLAAETTQLPVELIVEREIMWEHMSRNGISEEWLLAELRSRKLEVQQIFYAVKGTNGCLYIDTYEA
ncbi:DUF421 domain-containing protein [Ectobacillus ponti]|uniref:DUF421 domain-containing protein n=1 Tax=Ectobacillus ponti TaxID=2961894 RepID=A0AA41X9B4_9BACI|nr:DUF421 domain-containing protein [Ectobacillus ponti]